MKLIELFGKFSGYKVNFNKSKAIPLNTMTFPSHLGSAPIQWKPQGMRYLGININTTIEDIFDLNGPLLLKTIKEDIKRWTVLPISIWSRAEVLKINILPRLLFLISAIPLKFPPRRDTNRKHKYISERRGARSSTPGISERLCHQT